MAEVEAELEDEDGFWAPEEPAKPTVKYPDLYKQRGPCLGPSSSSVPSTSSVQTDAPVGPKVKYPSSIKHPHSATPATVQYPDLSRLGSQTSSASRLLSQPVRRLNGPASYSQGAQGLSIGAQPQGTVSSKPAVSDTAAQDDDEPDVVLDAESEKLFAELQAEVDKTDVKSVRKGMLKGFTEAWKDDVDMMTDLAKQSVTNQKTSSQQKSNSSASGKTDSI